MSDRPDYRQAFIHDLTEWLPQAAESVKRNGHMNAGLEHAYVDPTPIGDMIRALIDRFEANYKGGTRSGDVMDGMIGEARALLCEDVQVPHEDAKAFIVDYINYVAGHRCGMDLALYTSDI